MRKVIKISDLASGMVLARCVTDFNGKIVLAEGIVITEKIINRLFTWGINEVYVDCPTDEGDN